MDNRVDFVVIAGDIFDTARPSYADYLTFFDGLARLDAEGIPVYMCAGNANPYSTWQRRLSVQPTGQRDHVLRRQAELCALPSGRQACVRARRAWLLQPNVAWGCLHRRGRYASCRKRGPRGGRGIGSFGIGVIHTGLDLIPTRPPWRPRSFCVQGSTTGRSGMFINV